MLRELSIHNLAIVLQLELGFETGMTTLTGETGAGKSILIDALSLTLGERADSSMVRPGSESASVSALFELEQTPQVAAWLKEQELECGNECILRRTINADGRSRAYINGRPVTIGQLRELSEYLVSIHGQHQHQALLKSDHQRTLLDQYAQHFTLCTEVETAYRKVEKLKKTQAELHSLEGQQDKINLLQYQIREFEELNLQPQEIQALEIEHRKLSHAEQWQTTAEEILNALKPNEQEEKGSATPLLSYALTQLTTLKNQFPKLTNAHELIHNALIQTEEALNELQAFRDSLVLDPERQKTIDERLGLIHDLARKHRILPEQIMAHHQLLSAQAEKLENIQNALASISVQLEECQKTYFKSAERLSKSRQKAGLQLSQLITESLHSLEMSNGRFEIKFSEKSPTHFGPHGIDDIEFMVTTNPGLPLQPLRKIASGGELSRISLAIQVITAQKMTTPTLIFDEVDVGISGKTAEIVGKLMRKLAMHTQVLCVTHLAQVAAQGHHHYKVEKLQTEHSTSTHIFPLVKEQRIAEIARMLGGVKITQNTLAHAEEMILNVT